MLFHLHNLWLRQDIFYFVRSISYSSVQDVFVTNTLNRDLWHSSYGCFCSAHTFSVVSGAIFTIFFIFSMKLYFPFTKIEISFDSFLKKTFFSNLMSVKCSTSSSIDSIIPLNMSRIPSVESRTFSGSFSKILKSFEYSSISFSSIFLFLFLEILFQNYLTFQHTFLLLCHCLSLFFHYFVCLSLCLAFIIRIVSKNWIF